MQNNIINRCALALDNISDRGSIEHLIDVTLPWIGVYKIGLEQFVRFGPPVLEYVRKAGRKIFLDLKLHDIPNTVAKAVSSACDLEVDYLTIHTTGGSAMMKAAMDARNAHNGMVKPAIIGVTVLTSVDAATLHGELKVGVEIGEYVQHLASMAVSTGIDGIVCSAADLNAVKPVVSEGFIVITPGIRPAGGDSHDQKRITTPVEAIRAGSSLLVLGRAITAAPDPADAAKGIHNEIAASLPVV